MLGKLLNNKNGDKRNVVFSFDENHVYVVVADGAEVQYLDEAALDAFNNTTIKVAIAHLTSIHKLAGQKVSLVLPDNHYQLLMTDQLKLPEPEMLKAFQWKLKGLLDYPVNDAVLDLFLVPAHGLGGQRLKAFVVAAKKSFVEMWCDLFEQSLLTLDKVDISIFSTKNLVTAMSSTSGTKIAVNVSESKCQLTIFCDQNLYLVRNLDLDVVGVEQTLEKMFWQQLLLEIQRSTDYCISELKLAEPNEFLLGPAFIKQKGLLEFLTENLTKPVHCLDLNQLIKSKVKIVEEKQQMFSSCVGELLAEIETEQKDEQSATS